MQEWREEQARQDEDLEEIGGIVKQIKDEAKLEEYTNNNLKIYDTFLQEVEK